MTQLHKDHVALKKPLQTCQPKIVKTEMLWIFLFKELGNFGLNKEILESRKTIAIHAVSLKVQPRTGHLSFIYYLIPAYSLLKIYFMGIADIIRILFLIRIDLSI